MSRRPHHQLTAVKVRTLTKPGRYADGDGLYFFIDPRSGTKRWVLRTVVNETRKDKKTGEDKKLRKDIGLGSISVTSLAQAREEAARLRRMARTGEDPLAKRREELRVIPTFEQAARTVYANRSAAWRNPKHRAQWLSTLETYAFPSIGRMLVNKIETPQVLAVLLPIWDKRAETARRLRQRISTVLDWAKAMGHRTGDNPVLGVAKGLSPQIASAKHHAALPYGDVQEFIQRLRKSDSTLMVRLAFEFIILTAARTGEVLGAVWEEIDFANAIWTVPSNRMKTGREHRVPLSPRCIEILQSAKELSGGGHIFCGRKERLPLSSMAFLMALRRMKWEQKLTVHGFRSTFRDWAGEQTNFSRETCEAALAHRVGNKVEAAYRRGDSFDKRRKLMLRWATFALPQPVGQVVDFPRSISNG